MLYDRPEAAGGPFFFDRFETTCLDWSVSLAARGMLPSKPVHDAWGDAEPKLSRRQHPITRITLAEARAYATWRHCRLPRADEWEHAVRHGAGRDYPWGNVADPVRANTGDLGLGEVQPVGAFESGRDESGVYDLVGNAAEWSESFPKDALGEILPLGSQSVIACARYFLKAPRLVLGGHFASARAIAFGHSPNPKEEPWAWSRSPGEWGDTTGMRVASTPLELLLALRSVREPLTPAETSAVRSFLRDPAHKAALAGAWRDVGSLPGAGGLGALLEAELSR